MKASLHLGAGKASHNDRRFDLDKADHIDKSRVKLNQAFNFSQDEKERTMPFEDFEKLYYERHYSESLTATNDKYLAQRHPEKCRTMDDWLKTYKPTEAIIQVGNKSDQVSPKILTKAYEETMKELKTKYPQMKPLNMALHMDESTPHIHFRFVIEGHDKDGHIKPLKSQGLKEMGVQRPDLTKPEGRHNNPLMTFTAEVRDTLYRKIEELEIPLDRDPHLNQKHRDTLQYKKDNLAEEIEELERKTEDLKEEVKQEEDQLSESKKLIKEAEEAKKLQEEIDRQQIRECQEIQKRLKSLKKKRPDLKIGGHYTDETGHRILITDTSDLEWAAMTPQQRAEIVDSFRKSLVRDLSQKADLVEKAPGHKLDPDDLKDLRSKAIWSQADKENIMKTALLSARANEKYESEKFDRIEAEKQLKELKKDYKTLKEQVPSTEKMLLYKTQEKQIENLTQKVSDLTKDIKVRDDFIERAGIKAQFRSFCQEIGYKLKEAVQEMSHSLRMR